MHIETATYLPLEPPFMLCDILEALPEWVRSELIQDERTLYVSVETCKKEIVEYLDQLFGIGYEFRFYKDVSLEVTKTEIANFPYYRIELNMLEWGRQIKGKYVRPTCPVDGCTVGAKVIMPIKMTVKAMKKVDVHQMHYPWWVGHPPILIIATWLKKIFDEEGITGLSYDTLVGIAGKKEDDFAPPYLVNINNNVSIFADKLVRVRYLCEKHRILSSFLGINDQLYSDDFPDQDFHFVDRVTCDGVCYLIMPRIIVSSRLLQLLLKYKVRGLTNTSWYFKRGFIPEILGNK